MPNVRSRPYTRSPAGSRRGSPVQTPLEPSTSPSEAAHNSFSSGRRVLAHASDFPTGTAVAVVIWIADADVDDEYDVAVAFFDFILL